MIDIGAREQDKSRAEISDTMMENSIRIPGERQCLVELKNGRVILKQKLLSFEKLSETLQEIVKFREFLQSRIERKDPPLSEIPDEHKPVIAKLAHESDKTLPTLAKHIRQELLPTQNENTSGDSLAASVAFPPSVVEAAIKSIMKRNNYGLSLPNGGKAPAAVCLWRWEVKEEHWDWLPKSARGRAEQRSAERLLAKKDLQNLFDALPQDEQQAILDPKASKTQAKNPTEEQAAGSSPLKATQIVETQGKARQEEDTMVKQTKARQRKALDVERLAKEKERLDKKAEKEKREMDAQNKSRTIMANFFSKKAAAASASTGSKTNCRTSSSEAESDFTRTFKPYLVKKDAQLASANWFLDKSRGKLITRITGEVISIDDDDDMAQDIVEAIVAPRINTMTSRERLRSILHTLPSPADLARTGPPSKIGQPSHLTSVREVMSQLTEAEVAGDDNLVRSLLSKLRDRTIFPAKVLVFQEDARPGYFGTWTRSSKVVGARTPLVKDLAIADYNYDSGEEWEDEGAADADDVLDDGDEEPVDDESDSDLDSWLVDDEDDTALDGINPGASELQEPLSKRKIENEGRKGGKRRKVVIPLVPFAKGPCLESTIGYCDYEPFKAYKLKMLNDTPFPIDPFVFVSSPEDQKVKQTARGSDGSEAHNERSLPIHPSDTTCSFPPKKVMVAPKNAFPEAYLSFLLRKITALQAASITFLVESIYQELRVHKVKKNAIEAKVREVAEKCKEKKVWVIKSEANELRHIE